MLENTNNIAPSAYQVKIAVQQYAQEELESAEATRTRCPNYLHTDGRIYASKLNEPYVAVTVSLYHERFKTQIEQAVWPCVEAFINKGYLPVSSCGGHKDPWVEYYVTLAVGDSEQVSFLVDRLNKIENSKIEILSTLANVNQYVENNKIKFRPLEELEKVTREEYNDLNILFNRSYREYSYVRIKFNFEPFKLLFNPFNLFASHIFHKKEIQEFDKWKTNLVNYINSDEFEFFYG
jgi:hypothetical protein